MPLDNVRDILSDPAINAIDFSMGGIDVSPSMYQKVSQAIVDQKITVLVNPAFLRPNKSGKYIADLKLPNGVEMFDLLVLRSPDVGTGINEQFHRAEAIVHECTHAGFALLQVPNMTHTLHEAGAYAAQSIFALAKMLSLRGHPDRVTNTEPIEKAA